MARPMIIFGWPLTGADQEIGVLGTRTSQCGLYFGPARDCSPVLVPLALSFAEDNAAEDIAGTGWGSDCAAGRGMITSTIVPGRAFLRKSSPPASLTRCRMPP